MPSDPKSISDLTLNIVQETRVRASLEDTFAALLEELGPSNFAGPDTPMPMRLEAFPGGRWMRDLGDDNGHCWGMVQAIRRPTLLEIHGPLMMSFAVASNVQYRLRREGDETVLAFRHNALGLFPEGFRENVTQGWSAIATRVQARATAKS